MRSDLDVLLKDASRVLNGTNQRIVIWGVHNGTRLASLIE